MTIENAWQVAQACELYGKGLDFADALHYCANTDVEVFYTFDEKFIKNGKLANLNMGKPDSIPN
ncbi:MAG: hypothetical protein PHR16_10945 [Methylovulum sp.]|nr:hypothetical protein [Methylovulum sp.]